MTTFSAMLLTVQHSVVYFGEMPYQNKVRVRRLVLPYYTKLNVEQLKTIVMKAIKKQKTKKNQYGETLVYNESLRRWNLNN
jgi:hypothetical protein